MSEAMALYLALTLTGAAIALLYLAGLLRVLRHRDRLRARASSARAGDAWAFAALVPVVTPVAAWRAGSRAIPAAFAALVIAYSVLQLAAR